MSSRRNQQQQHLPRRSPAYAQERCWSCKCSSGWASKPPRPPAGATYNQRTYHPPLFQDIRSTEPTRLLLYPSGLTTPHISCPTALSLCPTKSYTSNVVFSVFSPLRRRILLSAASSISNQLSHARTKALSATCRSRASVQTTLGPMSLSRCQDTNGYEFLGDMFVSLPAIPSASRLTSCKMCCCMAGA